MKVVYPVIITKDNEEIPYYVEIPEISGMTQGTSLDNAIDMARDYIGLMIVDAQDDDEKIPESIYTLPKAKRNQIVTLVDADPDQYRRDNDARPVKKTLTIPNYLNKLGNKSKVNFSGILADGLRNKLNVK